MNINQNNVTIRLKNGGTYPASLKIIYYISGHMHQKTSNVIHPGILCTTQIPRQAVNITFIMFNLSLPGNPAFCHESIPRAVNTCFLLEGTPTTAICIPIPCSSINRYGTMCRQICTCK